MMGVRVNGIGQENPVDQESARCKCGSGKRDDLKSLVREKGGRMGCVSGPGVEGCLRIEACWSEFTRVATRGQ